MRSILFLILISFLSPFAHAEKLISTIAGSVGEEFLTTREVILYTVVENALSRPQAPVLLAIEGVKTSEFIREATAALIENAVYMEAATFGSVEPDQAEVSAALKKTQAQLKKQSMYKPLTFEAREIDRVVRRKLRARQFIRFKMDTANIPVSDQEAKDYFEQNRLKFENMPFETFKKNIKSYLAKQMVDRRLRDWFELLQSNYKVKNMLSL